MRQCMNTTLTFSKTQLGFFFFKIRFLFITFTQTWTWSSWESSVWRPLLLSTVASSALTSEEAWRYQYFIQLFIYFLTLLQISVYPRGGQWDWNTLRTTTHLNTNRAINLLCSNHWSPVSNKYNQIIIKVYLYKKKKSIVLFFQVIFYSVLLRA